MNKHILYILSFFFVTAPLQAQYYYVEYEHTMPLNVELPDSEEIDKVRGLLEAVLPKAIHMQEQVFFDAKKNLLLHRTLGDTLANSESAFAKVQTEVQEQRRIFASEQVYQKLYLDSLGACYRLKKLRYKPIDKEKTICSYKCKAAEAIVEGDIIPHTVWYCPNLPSRLRPFIYSDDIEGAVLAIDFPEGAGTLFARRIETKAKKLVKQHLPKKGAACEGRELETSPDETLSSSRIKVKKGAVEPRKD